MFEVEEVSVAVLDSPLVLEVVTDGSGSVEGVIGTSRLVELDAEVDGVVEPDSEVISDEELPEDEDTTVGRPGFGVVVVEAESGGPGSDGWTEESGYGVVVGTLEVLK